MRPEDAVRIRVSLPAGLTFTDEPAPQTQPRQPQPQPQQPPQPPPARRGAPRRSGRAGQPGAGSGPDAATDPTASPGPPDLDPLLAALATHELELVRTIDIAPEGEEPASGPEPAAGPAPAAGPDPGADRARRRGATAPPTPPAIDATASVHGSLTVELPADEEAVVLLEQDGLYTWSFGTEAPRRPRRRGKPAVPRGMRF
jgi:hypothetical protein